MARTALRDRPHHQSAGGARRGRDDRSHRRRQPLPASIRKDIIERTDGIPLFIEEMTKAVLEADSQSAAERTVAAAPLPRRYRQACTPL